MHPVSDNTIQHSTQKCSKIHRAQPVIARKVIAFQELIHLERHKKSAREAAELLEVPNSTMRSWRNQTNHRQAPEELVKFFSTPVGADFLQRNIISTLQLLWAACLGYLSSDVRPMVELGDYLNQAGVFNPFPI